MLAPMSKINIFLGVTLFLFIPITFAVQVASDSYTLVAMEDNNTVRLFKQNETAKIEISYPEGIFENVGTDFPHRKQYERDKIVFNATPSMVSWNGEYFLMDNSYSLIKYDGQKFDVIRYAQGFYSSYQIEKMIPAGKYWLLIYSDKGTPSRIVRIFSGTGFKDFYASPIWLLYILPVLIVIFIYRLLKELRKRKSEK